MASPVLHLGCDRIAARAIMPAVSSTDPDLVQVMAWRLPSRGLAGAAILGAALLQGHTRVDVAAGRARMDTASLVAAAGTMRVIEPRLTGGFAYAPWTSPSASTSQLAGATAPPSSTTSAKAPSSRLYTIANRLEQLVRANPQSASLRTLANAYLLIGRSDDAAATLERALAASPDDPSTLSDLSAVLLARSRAAEDTADAVRALEYAERAWRKAPTLSEAAFNAALARERLHLRSEARKAWLAYTQLDPDSSWSTEAARHVAALSTETAAQIWPRTKRALVAQVSTGTAIDARALVTAFPQAMREYLHEELLPGWGRAYREADAAGASRQLTAAEAICEALAARGDGTCRRVIAAIAAAPTAGRARLADAHHAFGTAMGEYRRHDFGAARRQLVAAQSLFKTEGSAEALWCDLYLAIVSTWLSDAVTGSRLLQALRTGLGPHDLALEGRVGWLTGYDHVSRERFGEALESYRRARAAYARADERENVARLDLLTAEALAKLGARRDAWHAHDRALAGLAATHSLPARQTILVGASFACLEEEAPDAALAFQEELLDGDVPVQEPGARAEALLYRFAILSRLGEGARARRDLEAVKTTAPAIPDASMRERFAPEVALREGQQLAATQPALATERFTAAIDLFRKRGLLDRLPETFRARSKARLKIGEAGPARDDLLTGIAAVEERAHTLADDILKTSGLASTWPLYADLIGLELDKGAPLRALAYAERAKSDSLSLPSLPCAAETPDATACWTRVLPPRLTVVYYVVLDDRLAIWVASSDGVRIATPPVPASRVRALVQDYRRALGRPAADAASEGPGGALFEQILGPVQAWLRPGHDLVFIPDDALYGVPFAGLYDARRGRFLVEDHLVTVSTSLAHFVRSADRLAATAVMRTSTAVVVADPQTSGPVSASLPRLAGAEVEAREMERRFARVDVLRGPRATPSALRSALRDAQVLHVASHARVNQRAPWRSHFVLASDTPGRGEEFVLMSEIATLPLARMQLAVLAACGSAEGPASGGGAALSLARPFLSAGVPSVVASLWPVSDRATAQLFVSFYAALTEGASPAAALRQAQLQLLRGEGGEFRAPRFWAPFVAIGGHHPTTIESEGQRESDN